MPDDTKSILVPAAVVGQDSPEYQRIEPSATIYGKGLDRSEGYPIEYTFALFKATAPFPPLKHKSDTVFVRVAAVIQRYLAFLFFIARAGLASIYQRVFSGNRIDRSPQARYARDEISMLEAEIEIERQLAQGLDGYQPMVMPQDPFVLYGDLIKEGGK